MRLSEGCQASKPLARDNSAYEAFDGSQVINNKKGKGKGCC